MSTTSRTQQPPSDAQLEAAWLELARRGFASCRCASLAEALAGPISGALVRTHARLLARGVHPFAEPATVVRLPAVQAPEPALLEGTTATRPKKPRRSPRPSSLREPHQQPLQALDRKRAAAGDRDDE
jgi:hypothetical protein